MQKLSIIIPVFNEEKTIEEIIKKITSLNSIEKEMIIVNDGSTDATSEILSKISKTHSSHNLTILNLKKNQGKGAAIRTALKHVCGDFCIIQDADLELSPFEIPKLLEPLKDPDVNVVYGVRTFLKSRTVPFFHKFGNFSFSMLVFILYRVWLSDTYTCYKMFRKSFLDKFEIESSGFEFEAEITSKILKTHTKVIQIPISYSPRTYKEGKKIHYFKDSLKGIYTIFKYRFLS